MSFAGACFFGPHDPNRREQFPDDRGNDFHGWQFGKTSVPSPEQLAGFPPQTGHHGPGPENGSPWLSTERIADTRRVWSKAYGRVISDTEAVEILMNVRRLAEVWLRATEEKEKA
jgi:hypothetical protein